MANINFASNNINHFVGATVGSLTGSYDSTKVPYSICVPHSFSINSVKFNPVVGEISWLHFRIHSEYTNSTYNILRLYDNNNRLIFTLRKNDIYDYIMATLTNGTQSVSSSNLINSFNYSTLFNIDIKLTINAFGLEAKIYFNSNLVITLSVINNPNNYTHPASMSFSTSSVVTHYLSEIISADQDTRNARLSLLRPITTGTYNNWNGLVSALADDDNSSGMTTTLANLKQSLLMSNYNGPTNVSNLVINTMNMRGLNGPSKITHLLRKSGLDYESSEYPVDYTLGFNLTDFKINPSTSLPWSSSDFTNMEFGFKSVA